MIASDGTITAAWAVLAAGAWSSLISIAGCALVPAFPVRGHLSGFRMAPASLAPILRHEHTYILQRADGFTIAGSSSEQRGFEREIDPAIVADIHRRASALLPGLASAHYEESWLGFRPGIAAQGPVIAPAGETALWLAYGHYRNGILLAPATAARVASGIIG
ncbi:MAG: FAD-dependent oxidoreductase [Acidobacteriia bacterium]|nr:FAD-dependent oxidoreductase [Terriglobia bacterium]